MKNIYMIFRLCCIRSLVTLVPVAAQGACDPPPAGLVGWWRGEGNAIDAIGTNNGTLANGASFTVGKVGQAFVFAGSGEAVQLGNPAGLQLQDFTIETWIQRGNASSSTADPGQTTAVFLACGYGGYGFGIYDDGSLFLTRVGIDAVTIPNLITDTNWHHVALTKAGTNVIFYVDGVSYPAPSPYTSVFGSGTDVAIGARGDNLANSFLGSIDELSIYNRALSPSEIQGIYNAASEGKCFIPVGPVISSQPTNETVVVGQSASFSVVAAGTPPLSYQWRFNTTNIVGATNATLTLASAQFTNAGNYTVSVSNLVNSILSTNAVLTVNPLPPCDPAPSGLVSWWAGEGNTLDQISGNNGTLVGGVSYGSGEVGQAFQFSAEGDQVCVPTSGFPIGTNDRTIECWVNINSFIPGEGADFAFYGANNENGGSYMLGAYSDQRLFFSQWGSGIFGPVLTANQWYHVAVTSEGTNTTLYLNGTNVASGNIPFNTPAGTQLFIGGIDYQFATYQMIGLIDEVSIYDRALSSNEIAAIYNAGNGGKCFTPVAPVITSQPTNETVYVSQPASFRVTVGGTPPLSYQWRFDATNIVDATNATLTMASAQFTNAGNYSVSVSNIVNSILSSNAVLNVNPPPPCDPAPTGLLSWWAAEGTTLDQISGYNGTLANGASFTVGKVGQAFVFAGSGEAVQLGNPAGLQLQDFTIETWIQRGNASSSTADPGQTTAVFMGYGYGGYAFGIVDDGSLFLTRVGIDNVTIPNLITDTNWHHVALTKAGTNVIFYVDGVSYPAPSPYTSVFNPVTNVAIGARGDNLANSFLGSIDELSIYNRALSQSEIQAIYNAASEGKCPAPCLPHLSTGTANLTNTAVGGVSITDEGCGYTNAPLIHLVGGGGSGAQVIAVVSNGVVVAINVINSGSGYISAPGVVIDPPFISDPVLGIAAISVLNFSNLFIGTNYQLQKFQSATWINQSASFKATNGFYTTMVSGVVGSADYRLAQVPVPVQATALAQLFNGFVVNVFVNNPGSGYVTVPAVTIIANVGSNATAMASISNGRVTSIAVTSAGIHYVNPVTVRIDPPPAIALSPTVVAGVRLDSFILAPYNNYQFQFKPDFRYGWSDLIGGLFSPPAVTNSQYFFLTNESGYFRLRYVP
jgi:hypothetical protein